MQPNNVRSFADLATHLRSLQPRAGSTIIAGIDGYGGSGKTTFATRLAVALDNCPIIHTDDFASWADTVDWWPRLLEQALAPLASNRPAYYQRYDWVERNLAEWRTIAPGGVILIEGVSATRREFKPYLSYRIWLDCPPDIRLSRGLSRDGADALPLWQKWMAEEDEYVARDNPQEAADLVVDGNPAVEHGPEVEFVVVDYRPTDERAEATK
jgi:uridine kinase